ncbi:uncharacterized protein LOC121662852 [Corvus kubaryi]|uniref:uncharacterized protein LOC121662852 n=1 Tax=Corvus kubaryi TaxID=68294 RepID=UPI001C04140B|nr:uncharacterized protein LOC121662852 [Corvus kubaryi]
MAGLGVSRIRGHRCVPPLSVPELIRGDGESFPKSLFLCPGSAEKQNVDFWRRSNIHRENLGEVGASMGFPSWKIPSIPQFAHPKFLPLVVFFGRLSDHCLESSGIFVGFGLLTLGTGILGGSGWAPNIPEAGKEGWRGGEDGAPHLPRFPISPNPGSAPTRCWEEVKLIPMEIYLNEFPPGHSSCSQPGEGGGSGDSREPRLPPLQPHFLGLFPPGSAELSPKSRTLPRPLADHTPWPGLWDPLEPPAVTRTRGKRCHRLSPRSPCPQETPPRGRRVVTRVDVVGVQVTEKGRTKGKAGLEPWNSHPRGDSSKIPPNLSRDQR